MQMQMQEVECKCKMHMQMSRMGTFFEVQRCALRAVAQRAADFEIRSAERFSTADVLALQRFGAALHRCAAVLKNMSAAAQCCSGSLKTQALQRHKSPL
jgi:hypothetical protein